MNIRYASMVLHWNMMIILLISLPLFAHDENKDTTKKLQTVSVMKVKKQRIQETLMLRGKIHSLKSVKIFPNKIRSGIIENRRIKKGDFVKKGSVLMYINQSSVNAETYRLSKVRAKISGVVSEIYVDDGDNVQLQTPLCKIIQVNKLKAILSVPSKKIRDVKKGSHVTLYFNEYPNKRIKTTINYISPMMHPSLPIFEVEAQFKNPNLHIKPGLNTRAHLFIKYKNGILIPMKSVLFENNIAMVFIYDSDTQRVKMTPIQLGQIYHQYIEVKQGIRVDDLILVSGQDRVFDNEKVSIFVTKEKIKGNS